MPACVESMMYVRETPWHGLGTMVQEAPTSEEAIRLAGLDWRVDSKPIFDSHGNVIKGYKANVRNTDDSVLGVVSDKYKIVNNSEAFDFTDSLIGEGVVYETAGSLRNGKTIWLLARMPKRDIVGDEFDPYICFTNSHDGLGAIRVCMTPIRVVCNNTLNMALRSAKRSWSTRHMGDMNSKLAEARETLGLANEYLDNLAIVADKLANEKMSDGDVERALDIMYPVSEDMTDRKKRNVEDAKNNIIMCMMRPDLAQFLNTKWGFVNAVSDFIGHSDPARLTSNYQENNWGKIIGGHPILDKAMAAIAA